MKTSLVKAVSKFDVFLRDGDFVERAKVSLSVCFA